MPTPTPYELELEKTGAFELFTDTRSDKTVTLKEVQANPGYRLLLVLKYLHEQKLDAKAKAKLLAGCNKQLLKLDPWEGFSFFLMFIRIAAASDRKRAQQAMDALAHELISRKIQPRTQDADGRSGAWALSSPLQRALALLRLAVLAHTVGLDSSGFSASIEALSRQEDDPHHYTLIVIGLGLHDAGIPAKSFLRFAFERSCAASEPIRGSNVLMLHHLALFVGDSALAAEALAAMDDASRRYLFDRADAWPEGRDAVLLREAQSAKKWRHPYADEFKKRPSWTIPYSL